LWLEKTLRLETELIWISFHLIKHDMDRIGISI
jgi:hypothetical protein